MVRDGRKVPQERFPRSWNRYAYTSAHHISTSAALLFNHQSKHAAATSTPLLFVPGCLRPWRCYRFTAVQARVLPRRKMGGDAVSGMFRVALVLAFLCPGIVRVASHQSSLGTATANRPASIVAGTNLRAQTWRTLQSGDTPAPTAGSTTVVTPAPFVAAGTPAPAPGPIIAVTSAPFVPADADSTCSNGFPGVESENGKTCCLTSCGFCAGDGCSNQGNATDCCATEISLYGEECDIAGS
ncbi:unnamed protein product, partial [Ectocarpus sp. 12 AP-2014]